MPLVRVLFAALLLLPSKARADEPRRYQLEYAAPPACPSEGEFVAQLQQRAPVAQRVASGEPDVVARVAITLAASVHGAIELQSRNAPIHRELDAPDCGQVVRGLALILALAIDPDAASASSVQEAPRPASANPMPSEPPTVVRPATSRELVRPSWWFGVGASVGLTGGVAPSPVLQEGFFLELGRGRAPGLAGNVRLAAISAHGSKSGNSGTADFELLALRASSCPYRLTRENPAFDACLSFDFGRLKGVGSNTLSPETSSASWFGPGAFFRATVRALPALLIQLELGALAPLARDRFYFGPSETIHRIPGLTGYGALNLVLGG